MKKNYLFFYLKTGGGHYAPAKAIAEYLQKYYYQHNAILVDGLEKGPNWMSKIIVDGYKFSQQKALWIFELMYAFNKFKPIAWLTMMIVSIFLKNKLKNYITVNKPDKIVIFHFLLISPVKRILKNLKLDIPVVVVVTDPYTAHPLWFMDKENKYIVFSEDLKRKIIKKGINESYISTIPFILNEKYIVQPSESEIINFKSIYGFDITKKVVLLFGGADGLPKAMKLLKRLVRNNTNAEIAIICGNNQMLFHEALNYKYLYGIDNLKVYPYINFVYDLISISDIVITKCGASTINEILLMNKLPIISSYIWEQEKGNLENIVNNTLGIYQPSVNKICSIVYDLINDETLLDYYKQNIINTKPTNGVEKAAILLTSNQAA